nr:NAD-dependent epimerase/dehydratase family protein [Armatimonadota bacterium]
EYSAVFDICSYTPQQAQTTIDAFCDRTDHYLYCSSTASYLPTDRYPIREDAPRGRGPVWGDYGADKAASEDLLLAAAANGGFPVTIFRPQWVYGPEDYQRLASALIDGIVQHGRIEIPFDGDYCLNWCYVLDLVAAMELASRKPSAIGKAYNVVGDEIMTTTGMIRACAVAAGKEVEIVYRPELKGKKGFSVQPIHLIVDNTAVKRELGLCPTAIEDGLCYTAEWLAKHREVDG